MIGSLLTRGFILVLGYIYPAYECFKSVERYRPDIEQLRFWCQYWITIAVVTVLERLGDAFVSWLPMYSEAKLAFIIYLWHPKTKGTTYIYLTFLQPFVARHEVEIDQNLNELRTRAGDAFLLYWHSALAYIQTRVFELLQYIVSQSQSSRHQGDLNVPHFPAPASVSRNQPAPPPPGHHPLPPPPPPPP
eukprot:c20137_g1_i2 orf=2-568(-)